MILHISDVNDEFFKKIDKTKWKKFVLEETEDFKNFTGTIDEIFTVKISKILNNDWVYKINDFIHYEITSGNKVILDIPKQDYELAKSLNQETDLSLRPSEPRILVHSTSFSSWMRIKASDQLMSWNQVKVEWLEFEKVPIGSKLGDLELDGDITPLAFTTAANRQFTTLYGYELSST